MLQADLAEHQAHALSHAGADAQQHALQGQLQRELVSFARAVEDGDGDAGQGDGHRQPGTPGEGFAEQRPAGERGENGR